MIGAAPRSPRTNVPGWLTDPEEDLLAEYAAQLATDSVFVGIGVEYGRSMSVIAHVSASRHIYGVELNLLDAYEKNMQEAGLAGRTTILIGDSQNEAQMWNGREIDLLFIDGAHDYPAVHADLNNWTPFVKQGGVVALHDVAVETNKLPHPLHHEVKRALDDWQAKQPTQTWKFVRSVDSTVILQHIGVAIKWEAPGRMGAEQYLHVPDVSPIEKDDEVYTRIGLNNQVVTIDQETGMAKILDLDDEAILSKLAAPSDLPYTPEIIDVDAEANIPTYEEMTEDEPKELPKRRGRKPKK